MAEGEASGVASELERNLGGGGHDDRERAGPEAAGEKLEAHGYFARKVFDHHEVVDKQRKAAGGFAALGGEDLADGGEVEGVGYQHVKRIAGNRDYPALSNDFGGATNDSWIGGFGVDFNKVCNHGEEFEF